MVDFNGIAPPPEAELSKSVRRLMIGGANFSEWMEPGTRDFDKSIDENPNWPQILEAITKYCEFLQIEPPQLDTKKPFYWFMQDFHKWLMSTSIGVAGRILTSLTPTAEDDTLLRNSAGRKMTPPQELPFESGWAWLQKQIHPWEDRPNYYNLPNGIRIKDDGQPVLVLFDNAISTQSASPIILSDPTREAFLEQLGPFYRPLVEDALHIYFKQRESDAADPGYLPGMAEKPSNAAQAILALTEGGLGLDAHDVVPMVTAKDVENRWIGPGSMFGETGLGRLEA